MLMNVIQMENRVIEFWRPKLLASPNIPKPLHGVNPRTILGKQWWDDVRKKAYATHDYKCWACGVPKQNAEYYKHLEAHEDYDFNWQTGKVELREIVALCHSCHNFIHSGRLYSIYLGGEISKNKVTHILERGFDICLRNNIKPYFGSYLIQNLLLGYSEKEAMIDAKTKGWFAKVEANWDQWHLVIEGKQYFSPFKNIEDWKSYFA